jgi:hypothetical protein
VLPFSAGSAPSRAQGAVRVKTIMQCIEPTVTNAEVTVEACKHDAEMSDRASLRCSGRREHCELGSWTRSGTWTANCMHMALPPYPTVRGSHIARSAHIAGCSARCAVKWGSGEFGRPAIVDCIHMALYGNSSALAQHPPHHMHLQPHRAAGGRTVNSPHRQPFILTTS